MLAHKLTKAVALSLSFMRLISLALNVSKHSITATLSFAGSDDEMFMLSARSMVVLMGKGLLIIICLYSCFLFCCLVYYYYICNDLSVGVT
jgi:hypothetical protein